MKMSSGVPSMIQLADRQLRNWELARLQRPERHAPLRQEVEDFIAVSRMVGVDGDGVAAALGASLGWPVFGQNLLEAMAGHDPVRQRLYNAMDERDLTWWEEAVRGVMDRSFVRNDYFRRLCETILTLARKGSAIFVGRGADLILPPARGLRVQLVASRESRIRRFATDLGLEASEAETQIQEIEHQRADFARKHFGAEALDPLRHDLILNMDRWSLEPATALILEARKLRHGSRVPVRTPRSG